MSFTTDRDNPDLTHGVDQSPTPQAKVYLVLSEEERAKGFVRPLRHAYRHVGRPPPKYPLRDLTTEEKERYGPWNYAKLEEYPESERPALGRYWTQAELDNHGCGHETRMALPLCETYARSPAFYGATYCCQCMKHLPVEEFVWVEDGERVGS